MEENLPRLCITLLLISLLAGCKKDQIEYPPMNYNAELPPGTLALRKISPVK